MRVLTVGTSALLVEVCDIAQSHLVVGWIRSSGIEADEVVPAATTVLIDGVDIDRFRPLLTALSPADLGSQSDQCAPVVTIPTLYDGPDLSLVADLWGCALDEVVRRHTSIEFTAAFCGFSPGFAYLSGLESQPLVPRLGSPRTEVPAGSVALADHWCGIYPTPSPGGWHLIGSTEVPLWRPTSPNPALLLPGTRVRFVEVTR